MVPALFLNASNATTINEIGALASITSLGQKTNTPTGYTTLVHSDPWLIQCETSYKFFKFMHLTTHDARRDLVSFREHQEFGIDVSHRRGGKLGLQHTVAKQARNHSQDRCARLNEPLSGNQASRLQREDAQMFCDIHWPLF